MHKLCWAICNTCSQAPWRGPVHMFIIKNMSDV
jgi:hypothetical protein